MSLKPFLTPQAYNDVTMTLHATGEMGDMYVHV
jgi:hypothetical protein